MSIPKYIKIPVISFKNYNQELAIDFELMREEFDKCLEDLDDILYSEQEKEKIVKN